MKKLILFLSILIFIALGIYAYVSYKKISSANVVLNSPNDKYLYIPTGSSFDDVVNILKKTNRIKNSKSFEWVAELKKYKNKVKPGRYLLKNNMSNEELVNLLRSGEQAPVRLTFNNIRTIEQLAGKVSKYIEADSLSIVNLLRDKDFVKKYGFNQYTIISLFIPNTYEFYWNTSAEEFIAKMAKEYKKFWTQERKNKAKKIGLSQSEVSTLASIVESETLKNDEKPIVAGVYINRLKRGIPLQADPTVIFAVGDFSIKRVLKKHLEINSPYNTYKYKGLPPGPIRIPSASSIDAVLNYKHHNYLYFCAKEDFSGYHNFAKTLRQHNANARKYQRALNKRRIYK